MKQFRHLGLDLFLGQAINTTKQADILPHLQVAIKGELLAHVPDMPLDLLALPIDIETGHPSLARRRPTQAAQHPHGGRLARSIGAQEPKDLALTHRETDVVHGGEIAKAIWLKAIKQSSMPGSIRSMMGD